MSSFKILLAILASAALFLGSNAHPVGLSRSKHPVYSDTVITGILPLSTLYTGNSDSTTLVVTATPSVTIENRDVCIIGGIIQECYSAPHIPRPSADSPDNLACGLGSDIAGSTLGSITAVVDKGCGEVDWSQPKSASDTSIASNTYTAEDGNLVTMQMMMDWRDKPAGAVALMDKGTCTFGFEKMLEACRRPQPSMSGGRATLLYEGIHITYQLRVRSSGLDRRSLEEVEDEPVIETNVPTSTAPETTPTLDKRQACNNNGIQVACPTANVMLPSPKPSGHMPDQFSNLGCGGTSNTWGSTYDTIVTSIDEFCSRYGDGEILHAHKTNTATRAETDHGTDGNSITVQLDLHWLGAIKFDSYLGFDQTACTYGFRVPLLNCVSTEEPKMSGGHVNANVLGVPSTFFFSVTETGLDWDEDRETA